MTWASAARAWCAGRCVRSCFWGSGLTYFVQSHQGDSVSGSCSARGTISLVCNGPISVAGEQQIAMHEEGSPSPASPRSSRRKRGLKGDVTVVLFGKNVAKALADALAKRPLRRGRVEIRIGRIVLASELRVAGRRAILLGAAAGSGRESPT